MFNVKIKALRESSKLNQEEFSKKIGVTKNTYMKYENGTQSPKLSTVQDIADYYHINILELVSDSEPSLTEKIATKIRLIDELDDDEKKSLNMLLEGLLLRHQGRSISSQLNE